MIVLALHWRSRSIIIWGKVAGPALIRQLRSEDIGICCSTPLVPEEGKIARFDERLGQSL